VLLLLLLLLEVPAMAVLFWTRPKGNRYVFLYLSGFDWGQLLDAAAPVLLRLLSRQYS
jgi:hypothetical protein